MADMFGDPAAASSGFADLLDDPRARAALLQFGISLMQPQYGQTPLGAIGSAIGSGGEAIGRIEEQDRKAAETSSKLAQRESSIGSQQGRLDAAADQNRVRDERNQLNFARNEATSADRQRALDLREKDIDTKNRQFGLSQAFRETDRQGRILSKDAESIEKKLKEEAKREADFKLTSRSGEVFKSDPTLAPFKGLRTRTEIEDALSKDPAYLGSVLQRHGVPGASRGPDTMQIPNAPQPISGTRDAEGNITNFPEAPRNPAMRTSGQTYMTPQGPLEWTGAGWRKPQGI